MRQVHPQVLLTLLSTKFNYSYIFHYNLLPSIETGAPPGAVNPVWCWCCLYCLSPNTHKGLK